MLQNRMLLIVLLLALPLSAKQKVNKKSPAIQQETLQSYVMRMQQQALDLSPKTVGSLWTDYGRLAAMGVDYRAAALGDPITILVVQDLSAQNAASVSTNRAFSATSGITGLAGHISTSGVQNIFSPASTESLTGKSQGATTSSLRTQFAGRVVGVLANGVLVIEAQRQVTMNNERQTILLRGLVRPGDIGVNNTVASNAIAELQLELKGKGVLSDGTRPPNIWTRWLLRLIGF